MIRRIIFFILLTIPAFWFLLTPNYYNMHDDLHPIRQLELEKCLLDGQIPCRWVPDMGYGYGYPLFNYYPPLPYLIGQIFRFAGFSFLWSVKLTAVLQIICSGLAMFLLAKVFFGPVGGLLSGLLYVYAPYHAVNIFVRGAMNEAWAAVFFPLIFYFIYQLSQKYKLSSLILLSLSLTGLLLSHNPMTLIFTPFIIFWSIFCLFFKRLKTIIYILSLLLSAIFCLCLSAFFTIPSLLETSLVNINAMFSGYYSYFVHFTSLRQLFISNFWSDGPSTWGTNDQMSFAIGYLQWLIPIISIGYISIRFLKKKSLKARHYVVLTTFIFAILTTFLTHERSNFIWQIFTPIQKIQFPWRFLNLSAFFFSLSAGGIYLVLKKIKSTRIITLLSIITVFSLISLNWRFFIPVHYGPITDQQKFDGSWKNFTTGSIQDYLPTTVITQPDKPPIGLIDDVFPTGSTFVNQKHGTDWLSFSSQSTQLSRITLGQFYFPKFTLYIDQKEKPITIDKLGRIVFELLPGQHQVYLKLISTPIRTISNLVSFIAWLTILFLFVAKLWTKKRYPLKK